MILVKERGRDSEAGRKREKRGGGGGGEKEEV
jgi:hypothetical protein